MTITSTTKLEFSQYFEDHLQEFEEYDLENEGWDKYVAVIIPPGSEFTFISPTVDRRGTQAKIKWEVIYQGDDNYMLVDEDKLDSSTFTKAQNFLSQIHMSVNKVAIFIIDTIFKIDDQVFTVGVDDYFNAYNLNASPWKLIEWVEGYLVFNDTLTEYAEFGIDEEVEALECIKNRKLN